MLIQLFIGFDNYGDMGSASPLASHLSMLPAKTNEMLKNAYVFI